MNSECPSAIGSIRLTRPDKLTVLVKELTIAWITYVLRDSR